MSGTDIVQRMTEHAHSGDSPTSVSADMLEAAGVIEALRERDVATARRKARELEKEIAIAIARFHNETGVTVHGLHLRVDRASGPDGVLVDIRYSVNVEAVL